MSTTKSNSKEHVGKPRLQLTDYAIPILVIHFIALGAFYPAFITWTNVILLFVTVLVFGQGINLGYHRLLTHRSLRVPKWLEYSYVWLAICSLEETPAKWVSTHRKHHSNSDKEDDPHSPILSFFWSHMGWLIFKRKGENSLNVEHQYARDILADDFYLSLEKDWMKPNRIYLYHLIGFYVIAFLLYVTFAESIGAAAFSSLGAIMWGVFLRTVVVWHITWSVNSVSHVFGYQSHKTGEHSRNNWFVALIASGEGWHNNHHHDPGSASVQFRWWEIDLTYYHILLLKKLGLATRVVRPRHLRKSSSIAASSALSESETPVNEVETASADSVIATSMEDGIVESNSVESVASVQEIPVEAASASTSINPSEV